LVKDEMMKKKQRKKKIKIRAGPTIRTRCEFFSQDDRTHCGLSSRESPPLACKTRGRNDWWKMKIKIKIKTKIKKNKKFAPVLLLGLGANFFLKDGHPINRHSEMGVCKGRKNPNFKINKLIK
jgi:hypothetical protein